MTLTQDPFEPTIFLPELCTPIEECQTVSPGHVQPATLETLVEAGFDQAPVVDAESGELHGLVTASYLRSLMEAEQVLKPDDEAITAAANFFSTDEEIHLRPLLDRLVESKAVLVYHQLPEFVREVVGTDRRYIGLLTFSDLNSVGVRLPIYDLLSSLESHLATLVRRHFEDPWDWLGRLNEESQVRILGFWELSKRRGVDIGPIAATMLPQLLNIIGRTKPLLEKLAYARVEFESTTARIAELRNCVMHPVRPLVLGWDDVSRLRTTIDQLRTLRTRIQQALWPRESE